MGELLWKGNKNLLLMVHGFSGYPENLSYLAKKIHAELKYSIKIPRLKGHKKPLEEFKDTTGEEWIEQLKKIIKENEKKYEQIYLLGFSMGTLLATILVSEYNLFEKLILVAPPFKFPFKKEILLGLAPYFKPFKKYHYKRVDENNGNYNLNDESMRRKYPVVHEKDPIESIIEFNKIRKIALNKIGNIDIKTLAILSKKDRIAVFKNYKFLKNNVKDSIIEYLILEKSGHMIPIDYERDEVAKKIIKFINEREKDEKK